MGTKTKVLLSLVGIVLTCAFLGFLFGYFGSAVTVVTGMMVGALVGAVIDVICGGIAVLGSIVFGKYFAEQKTGD